MLIHVTTSLQSGVVRPPSYVAYLLPEPIAGKMSAVRLNGGPSSGGKFVTLFGFVIFESDEISGSRFVLFMALH